MTVLTRKVVRDLLRAKWQYAAVALMVVLGVAFFNAAYSCYVNLTRSYANSYQRLDFEDFGVAFQAAPERVADRIEAIAGVKGAEGRLVEDVAVELPGKHTKKLVGRLISIPVGRGLKVNQLKIVAGASLSRLTPRGVLLEASFAEYHKLGPGSIVIAKKGSSEVRLTVVGIVQSAEYLYVVQSKQDLFAFPDTFGVMFVSQDVLGPLVGKPNQINQVRVAAWDPRRAGLLMKLASGKLTAYRPEEPVPRKDQPSYQMLEQDVQGFQAYAVLFPAFFLSVAAATVYTLLMRMVHQQRSVIGLLRSLGFSRTSVVLHYLAASLLVGLVGAALGTLVGIYFAGWISRLYMAELQVPFIEIVPRWDVLATGVVIGVLTCAISGVFPARYAAKIPPAEAMRPATPSFGSRSIRIDWLLPWARLRWRIPLRNVFRQNRRTLSTAFGIVAGVTLMILAKGILDSSEIAMDEMMSGAYRSDLQVSFVQAQTHSVVARVTSWPGVIRAEGRLEVPVDMRHGSLTYSALLSGMEPASRLHRIKDYDGNAIHPVGDAAIFGPTLRKRLHLELGDTVEVTLPKALGKEKPTTRLIRVGGFNDESIGTVGYLQYETLGTLFRKDLELPQNAVTSVAVQVSSGHLQTVRQRLLDLTGAGSVIAMPELRKMVKDMMKTMQRFVWIMELFGAALAFAMVFNMVTINVLERETEVATLRTIGMSNAQVSGMIVIENMVVSVAASFLGLPLGRLFVEWFWKAAQTDAQQDLFNFVIRIRPETYVLAAGMILIVSLLCQIPALMHVGSLDLAKATKERST